MKSYLPFVGVTMSGKEKVSVYFPIYAVRKDGSSLNGTDKISPVVN